MMTIETWNNARSTVQDTDKPSTVQDIDKPSTVRSKGKQGFTAFEYTATSL